MNILLCGDSFSCDGNNNSWVELLRQKYSILNLSQAGCSQYRIYKQLLSQKINQFDKIIVSHTSPFRFYTKANPNRYIGIHKNCDLIYEDVKHFPNYKFFFEEIVDIDWMIDYYNLLCEKIDKMAKNKLINITHFERSSREYKFKNEINFNKLFLLNRGDINHYNIEGNLQIYKCIDNILNE